MCRDGGKRKRASDRAKRPFSQGKAREEINGCLGNEGGCRKRAGKAKKREGGIVEPRLARPVAAKGKLIPAKRGITVTPGGTGLSADSAKSSAVE